MEARPDPTDPDGVGPMAESRHDFRLRRCLIYNACNPMVHCPTDTRCFRNQPRTPGAAHDNHEGTVISQATHSIQHRTPWGSVGSYALPLLLLGGVLVFGAGCGGSPEDSGDTASGDSGDSGETASFFEPVVFLFEESWAASDGSTLEAFSWSDGSVDGPTISITFLTEEWFVNNDPSESCTWQGTTTVLEESLRDQDTLWAGFELSLELLETDCTGFQEDTWEGGDPTARLHTAEMWTGYGPLEEFEALARPWFVDHGENWEDWEDYTFAQSFALQINDSSKVVKTGLVLAYALEDGVLQDAGGVSPLPVDDELPTGALHGLGIQAFEVEKLP